mmetsp:Transcript_13348/g.37960  ORF Transcript_13348/g.37960 Transcript_13348/m.37960 type:complete len:210 (-) Transcript_13348:121-750(-)
MAVRLPRAVPGLRARTRWRGRNPWASPAAGPPPSGPRAPWSGARMATAASWAVRSRRPCSGLGRQASRAPPRGGGRWSPSRRAPCTGTRTEAPSTACSRRTSAASLGFPPSAAGCSRSPPRSPRRGPGNSLPLRPSGARWNHRRCGQSTRGAGRSLRRSPSTPACPLWLRLVRQPPAVLQAQRLCAPKACPPWRSPCSCLYKEISDQAV